MSYVYAVVSSRGEEIFFFGGMNALKRFLSSKQPRPVSCTHMEALPADLLPLVAFCEREVPDPQAHTFHAQDIRKLFFGSVRAGVCSRRVALGLQPLRQTPEATCASYLCVPGIRGYLDRLHRNAAVGESGLCLIARDVRRIAKHGFRFGWTSVGIELS